MYSAGIVTSASNSKTQCPSECCVDSSEATERSIAASRPSGYGSLPSTAVLFFFAVVPLIMAARVRSPVSLSGEMLPGAKIRPAPTWSCSLGRYCSPQRGVGQCRLQSWWESQYRHNRLLGEDCSILWPLGD